MIVYVISKTMKLSLKFITDAGCDVEGVYLILDICVFTFGLEEYMWVVTVASGTFQWDFQWVWFFFEVHACNLAESLFTKILGSMLLCCKKGRFDPIGYEILQHWSTLHRGPVWFWEQCGQHLLPDAADCEGAEASIALSTPFLKQMSYCSIDLSLKCQSCFINFFLL